MELKENSFNLIPPTGDINIFISKYNDVRFDEFKDISITLRSKGMDEIVYIVDRFGGNRPVYFVTFNLQKQSVTYIDKTNLEKSKVQGYLLMRA